MSCTTTKVLRERGGVDAEAGDGVGADDVERGEVARGGGVEDLEQVEAGRGGRAVLKRDAAGGVLGVDGADRGVAGEHVGEQAHVGRAARVGVVGEQGELCGWAW